MLGEALLDLARLLVGVDVEHELLGGGVSAELVEPVAGARADGVGGDPDRDPAPAESLHLSDIRGHRRLTHALETAASVGDVEAREREPGRLGCLRGGKSGVEPEVVELADCRKSGRAHLAIRALVELAHRVRRLALRLGEHAFAPGPEVAARRPAAERPLERVAVGVHEAGERDHSCHGRRH